MALEEYLQDTYNTLNNKIMRYDYLIVGSGLFGAVISYCLIKAGKRCLVIDKRPHIGGNVYTENIHGINVHKYGAHIFHTSDKRVWNFVNSFVEFNRYTNSPVANYHGRIYNLPFNMNTFYAMWGCEGSRSQNRGVTCGFHIRLDKQGVSEPRNLEEQAISLVGKDIYYTLIKEYTEKQWGRRATELPAFIIKRLPVRHTYDNNYFNDLYQGIPIGGYTVLIEKLLGQTEVRLKTDFFDNRFYIDSIADSIIFTGEIDRYFDYCYGHLEYRTVTFDTSIWEGVANY